MTYLKCQRKDCQTRILYPAKLSFKNEDGKSFFQTNKDQEVLAYWPNKKYKNSPSDWKKMIPDSNLKYTGGNEGIHK